MLSVGVGEGGGHESIVVSRVITLPHYPHYLHYPLPLFHSPLPHYPLLHYPPLHSPNSPLPHYTPPLLRSPPLATMTASPQTIQQLFPHTSSHCPIGLNRFSNVLLLLNLISPHLPHPYRLRFPVPLFVLHVSFQLVPISAGGRFVVLRCGVVGGGCGLGW